MINNTGETPLLGKLHGRIKETFKFLDSEDIKGKVILDIGCGYGWFENEIIKKHPKKIIASEISEADLSTIKKYITNPKIVFKKTSAIDLSINDGTIDTVVSWEVIEHIPDKTEHKMFSEARRVLKPHGSFYLSTPYKGFFSTLLDPAWWLIGHRHYNESAMELFAKYNGFNLVKISIKGGFWSILAILNLYFSKWILRRQPIFSDFISKQIDNEFKSKDNGSVNLFVKFKKIND